ncbi:MAG: hypothetical protein AVDCRST_MAG77-14 [uncultured Chloroflexi bacterium]|uniref:Uncharacterized protein n=1 Tax=uncultured Chloroflexota bacterium TaxID=166587 RepID=A0A6J4H4B9_9CHLR|nr:MAG: hypothetical protein AVDCRST_MAG77-14 [uncultured Chloroflexota bacterium]
MTPTHSTSPRGAAARLARRAAWRPAALSLATVGAALGLGPSRADVQPGQQPSADFPLLSLGYADEEGPGQVTIVPQGADSATAGTVIMLAIAQARGTLSGTGFVRQVDGGGYVIAASVTAPAGALGDGYFLAGTLVRGDEGVRWRGGGRRWALANPSRVGEWHVAAWPVIEPSAGQQLTAGVRLDPLGGSGVSGAVTLVALPDGETRFELQLDGLTPGAEYGVHVLAGTPAQPSGSFTQLTAAGGDAAGRANASGRVRFRGNGPVALLDIASGDHFIAVVGMFRTTGAAGMVAAGAIPALQPLG